MKANEFVKKYGWEYAKHILNEDSVILVDLDYAHLKRLVESHELVESYGGLDKAKKRLSTEHSEPYYNYSQRLVNSLKQAIADVESCQ